MSTPMDRAAPSRAPTLYPPNVIDFPLHRVPGDPVIDAICALMDSGEVALSLADGLRIAEILRAGRRRGRGQVIPFPTTNPTECAR